MGGEGLLTSTRSPVPVPEAELPKWGLERTSSQFRSPETGSALSPQPSPARRVLTWCLCSPPVLHLPAGLLPFPFELKFNYEIFFFFFAFCLLTLFAISAVFDVMFLLLLR